MRTRVILHITGGLVLAVGLSMALAAGFSFYYGDAGLSPLLYSMAATIAAGGAMMWVSRGHFTRMTAVTHGESVLTVTGGWLAACFFGSLPYIFGGVFPTLTDSVFESVSGFSATGATVMTDIEAVAPGLLMWRATTHWLGGMGIIILSLAIFPFIGVGGMQLYKAEIPGPLPDRLTPRLKDTARILWQVYLLMTVVQLGLLLLGEMNLYEAIAHTFSTVATGGFSTRNASLAAFSAYSQWVCIIFMFLASVNFVLHFNLLRGSLRSPFVDEEFRFYFIVVAAAALLVFSQIVGSAAGVEEAARTAVFQVVSIATTTAFSTADYAAWSPLCQMVMLFLIIAGGSAGSTAGGVKCMRLVLLGKHLYHEIFALVHPRAVRPIRFNRSPLPANVVKGCVGFISLYFVMWVMSSALLTTTGLDLATASSAALSCLSNVGPGFGDIVPSGGYQRFPALAKWVVSFDMLLGRLELFTLLVLCFPEFWRR